MQHQNVKYNYDANRPSLYSSLYSQYIRHDPYLHMSQVLQVSIRVVCIYVYAIRLLQPLIAIRIDTQHVLIWE